MGLFCCGKRETVRLKFATEQRKCFSEVKNKTKCYLGHLHLLHGSHISCFFAPVALHSVALDAAPIYRHYGMGSPLMRVEPKKENTHTHSLNSSICIGEWFKVTEKQYDLPHKWVAFLRENPDLHYLPERRESLSHQLIYSGWGKTHSNRIFRG